MDNNIKLPKVSVIMPAYNACSYINDAINSVINQTYKNWELIIIDDGSTDITASIVKKWTEKDNRIQYYYQDNGKQGKARNLGISKSRGQYLAFLDADDLWLLEKLEFQIKEIQEKKVDLVFSDSYSFNDNQVDDISQKMGVFGGVFYDHNSIKLFLEGNRIPILTVLVKREKIINVGGFSEKLEIQNVEDYHLWLKLLMTDNVFYSINHVLAKYRIHSSSATSTDKLVIDKVPNVFFDLLKLYPNYKDQIERVIKLKFQLIYEKKIKKKELSTWIKKNTKYLSKSELSCYFYLLLNFLFPTKVTKRILIFLLNG